MSKPIAPKQGIAMAFPNVCKTQVGPAQPPIPYPSIAQLSGASGVTDVSGKEVLVGPSSLHVLLMDSVVTSTMGDEPALPTPNGGVRSGTRSDSCTVVEASGSVVYGSSELGIARFMDRTEQNKDNANGFLLAAFPTVLVGD
jgi:hypothetical protein